MQGILGGWRVDGQIGGFDWFSMSNMPLAQ
jgi:hypothetical protein